MKIFYSQYSGPLCPDCCVGLTERFVEDAPGNLILLCGNPECSNQSLYRLPQMEIEEIRLDEDQEQPDATVTTLKVD